MRNTREKILCAGGGGDLPVYRTVWEDEDGKFYAKHNNKTIEVFYSNKFHDFRFRHNLPVEELEEVEARETTDVTGMENSFEEDYRELAEIELDYDDVKTDTDMDAVKNRHQKLIDRTNAKGEIYCEIFREFVMSKKNGNKILTFIEWHSASKVGNLMACLKENGITGFVLAPTWGGVTEFAWDIQQNGYRLDGMAEVNGNKGYNGTHEKLHGFVFKI